MEKPKDPFEGIPLVFPGVKPEFFDGLRARIAALRPGCPISTWLLSRYLKALIVGDSVFVHSGLLLNHDFYELEKIN